jgi:hypothetical protein
MLIGDKMEDDKEKLRKLLEKNFLAKKVEIELKEILESRDYFRKALENLRNKGEIPSISEIIGQAFQFGKADGAIAKLINYLMDRGLVSRSVAFEIFDFAEDVGTDAYYTMSDLGSMIDEVVRSRKREIVE